MPVKRKTTNKTKRTVKKTSAKKKTAVKKTTAKKKTTVKKKVAAKKKAVTKKAVTKKTSAKKKTAVKKTTAKKKTTVKKKVAAKKKAVTKKAVTKKTSAKKKTAVKKTTAKKKTAVKKATTVKKKAAVKKTVAKKVTTKKKVKMPKITEVAPTVNLKTVAEKIEEKKAAPMVIEKEHLNHDVIGPVASIPAYQAKLGEEYMNLDQLKHFTDVLFAWKRDLMEGVDKTVGHLKEDAENYADLTDRATQEEEFSLELRTRDRERKLLKKIEDAIQRINDDDFGYCEACGVEIGLPRLEVRPTATLCIDCKTVEEIREKQVML